MAKYWTPAHHPQPELLLKGLTTVKDQRSFEKGLWDKTRKSTNGDVIIYDGHLVLYRQTLDLFFYIVSTPNENELVLSAGFSAFYDALSLLFRNQIEKRVLLDNLDVLLLTLDETFDDGIIMETDSTAIAARVSRSRSDASDIVINEQTISNAYNTIKERIAQQIKTGGF